jgi:hypothetical protein
MNEGDCGVEITRLGLPSVEQQIMWKDKSESVDWCSFFLFTVRIAESDRRRRLLSHMTSSRWASEDLGALGPPGPPGRAQKQRYGGKKVSLRRTQTFLPCQEQRGAIQNTGD